MTYSSAWLEDVTVMSVERVSDVRIDRNENIVVCWLVGFVFLCVCDLPPRSRDSTKSLSDLE